MAKNLEFLLLSLEFRLIFLRTHNQLNEHYLDHLYKNFQVLNLNEHILHLTVSMYLHVSDGQLAPF